MINIREFLGLTYYTSTLDEFLNEFDRNNHQISESQKKEIEKYSRIYALRDHSSSSDSKKIFWDNF
ncbi:MAG: hypothetical protein KIT56_01970 [Gammaproteobacteria bacterium]|nr:hypothetical protein [Gammaproteobacteria bacterium]MCW5582651.1 hypothetical protein [Gammaproteobacteria bacterium]